LIAISRPFYCCLLAFSIAWTIGGTCWAAAGVQQIDTPALQSILARNETIHLINVLPKVIHDAQHIPGSINIPLGQIGEAGALPQDRDAPLVFYCMGLL
jgi:hypothetical protein